MRIATGWDFAYLNRPLASITVHSDASSSSLGTFTPDGYRASRFGPDMLHERRLGFLAETQLPDPEARRLARIAERTYRREVLSYLSMRADHRRFAERTYSRPSVKRSFRIVAWGSIPGPGAS